MTTELVYLDIETTGLNPDLHEVWEVAYAVEDEPIQSFVLVHDLATADPQALELNGYYRRGWRVPNEDADMELKKVLAGNTVVGANPSFDTEFLRARWGTAPWHHRKIDVEVYAQAVFKWDRPKGLHDVYTYLKDEIGMWLPAPDHTAAGDVDTTRSVYRILRGL